MIKKKWYKNRILWKAGQFKLLPASKEDNFEITRILNKLCLNVMDYGDEIILLFVENEQRWPFLTTNKIVSYHNGCLYELALDEINKKAGIYGDKIQEGDVKTQARFIVVGVEDLLIWTPDSKTLFALINILRMFPLKKL